MYATGCSLTRQLPRSEDMIWVGAPGCPSMALSIAVLERRLSTMSTASSVSMMPIGTQIQLSRNPAITVSRSGMSTAPATSGTNHLSCFAVNLKTMPICFRRSPKPTFSCEGFAMAEV